MPPKRGRKRKAATSGAAPNGIICSLAPQDRSTWSGWVEMESEPAFFNAMLKDMGVHDAKIQEVISMEPEMLVMLPQPVYGLIFLFRYRTEDEQVQQSGEGTEHIWFANQVPDFACATIALLNIVNNISELTMGKELRDFKDFTKDRSPLERGQMIDDFDFVRRIHNSFARESDILNADLHTKIKYDRFKKKEAAAKGRATKEAKKAAQATLQKTTTNVQQSTRTPRGGKRAVDKDTHATSARSTPAKLGSARSTPDSYTPTRSTRTTASPANSPPTIKDASDDQFSITVKAQSKKELDSVSKEPQRRSARAPKPRKDVSAVQVDEKEDESGYHFIAYMPIRGHVWKLDGLNYFPTDMGSFQADADGTDGASDNWIDAISPTIMNRMVQFEDGSIEYSLMAVVHNPAVKEKAELLANVKAIQTLDAKLNGIAEDWWEMEGAETKKEVVTGPSLNLAISQGDIDAVTLPEEKEKEISAEDDFLKLIELRQRIISKQAILRSTLRDSIASSREDDEKARHRRHDYGSFVKGWLGALAENGVLADLL